MSIPPARIFLLFLLLATWALGGMALGPGWVAWHLVPALGLAVLGMVTLGSINPDWQLFAPVITRGPVGSELVALTFDDGPPPDYTPVVLEALAAAGAQATFFLVGDRVRECPDLARAILDGGHQLAHHSDRHYWPVMFSRTAAASDVALGSAAIEQATGLRPRFYRPPVGLVTPELGDAVREAGMLLAAWSVRAFDGLGSDPATVRSRVASKVRGGDIVLLHDGRSGARKNVRPAALDALAGILDDLSERNLRSVTLAQLLDEPAYLPKQQSSAPCTSRSRRSWLPRFVGLTLVAVVAFCASVALASGPGGPFPESFRGAATALSANATVRARFQQTKSSNLFREDVVRSGTLELRNSDHRLLWSYDGGPQLLLAGGRFHPTGAKDGVASPAGPGPGLPGSGAYGRVMEALFFVDVSVLEQYFSCRDLGAGRFELVPTDSRIQGAFRSVELWVSGAPATLHRVVMEEASGDRTEVVFTDVAVGVAIPDERLRTPRERASRRRAERDAPGPTPDPAGSP